MKNHHWYKPTKKYEIVGVPALRHKKSKELCLFGKKGQIWEYDKYAVGVLVYGSSKKAIKEINKIALNPQEDLRCKSYEEMVFVVEKEYIKELTKLLTISKDIGRQYANMEAFIESL